MIKWAENVSYMEQMSNACKTLFLTPMQRRYTNSEICS
jgi:hypothetical protein